MKAPNIKLLVLAASFGAALVSGCAELTTAPAAAGASAADAAQSAIDTPGNAQSPYPAATDAGIF